MKKETEFNEVRKLVRNGKIKEALSRLEQIAKSKASRNDILLLESRYSNLMQKINRGTINHEEEEISYNRIIMAILSLVNDIEEEEFKKSSTQTESKLAHLSEEDFFRISKAATIVIEVEKVKEEFYKHKWETRADILSKLYKFSSHTTIYLAKEIYAFLYRVAVTTRSGMNSDVASELESLVIEYFPYIELGEETPEFEYISFRCANIGHSIFYDAVIYLKDLTVGVYGLQILKWIYWEGKERELKNVMLRVKEVYQELESTLNRPERTDLGFAKELLQVFKNDLDNRGLQYPLMPDYLFRLI